MKRHLLMLPFLLLATTVFGYPSASLKPQAGDIIFSHAKHVTELEIACVVCHSSADTSASAADRNLPSMEICATCHEQVPDDAKCGMCHRNANEPSAALNPDRPIAFNHKAHVAQNVPCTVCHAGIPKSHAPGDDDMPRMSLCMTCHNGNRADSGCERCHEKRIALVDIHPDGWRHQHGDRASTDRSWCAGCHQQEGSCLKCHRGDNTVGSIHDLNYQFTHGLDARNKEADCAKCHDTKQFCNDCHARNRRIPLRHSAIGWKQNHGDAARNDIENCASCHDVADPTCARAGCHRDADGVRGTDPTIHSSEGDRDGEGPWHNDNAYFCFQCHTNTREQGRGFCGYCHDRD